LTCGRTTLAAPRRFGSITTRRGQTGHLVDLLGHGHAFFDVLELHLTGELGDDRAGQRIPVRPAWSPALIGLVRP